MKRILITGINSYIGNACEQWLLQWPEQYQVDKISVRNNTWKEQSWNKYDVIIHVAGIAHNSSKRKMKDLYYQVNRDLTYEIGKKARKDGISHFLNMSSIIVFGSKQAEINSTTTPNPDNFYGDSKLQAEELLDGLVYDSFMVTHVRTPKVYGENSKGNFPKLVKIANGVPFFPDFKNKKSMIYIKNLTELIKKIIENEIGGYIHPQNPQYVQTSTLVKCIANNKGHNIILFQTLNPIIKRLLNVRLIKKVFGDLYYSEDMFDKKVSYQIFDLESSIQDIYS